MSEEQNAPRDNEGEISLVDILAVCLRYRKIIIGLPAVVVVVAAVILYALPMAGINLSGRSYTAQISSSIDPMPIDLKDYIDVDTVTSLNAAFSSIQVVGNLYTKYFPAEVIGLEPESLNAYIQKEIVGKKLSYAYDSNTGVYTLRLKTKGKKQAQAFLFEIWGDAAAGIQKRIGSELATAADLLKKQLDAYGAEGKQDSASAMAKSVLMNTYQRVVVYQTKPQFPLFGDQKTIVFADSGRSRMKTVILGLLASLFVAIIGAFILNAARGIREDPQSMAKIREALGKSK